MIITIRHIINKEWNRRSRTEGCARERIIKVIDISNNFRSKEDSSTEDSRGNSRELDKIMLILIHCEPI
jgi:hypothetical protein